MVLRPRATVRVLVTPSNPGVTCRGHCCSALWPSTALRIQYVMCRSCLSAGAGGGVGAVTSRFWSTVGAQVSGEAVSQSYLDFRLQGAPLTPVLFRGWLYVYLVLPGALFLVLG